MKCVQIQVNGKVQGVWFRASTQRKANELNIKGIVKNLPNGDVYIEAEGEENALEDFVKWCHQGSDHSRVDNVTVSEIKEKSFEDFKIVR
ncbi:MAG: acylphosphatase [Granulosicoccus sp.]|mgnify:CR=1 FL=1|jgi:acylphosphatase|tara:strand:- start:146 stop:415 length:270 start_codon:yes stop_codon:yes gene_type:complete